MSEITFIVRGQEMKADDIGKALNAQKPTKSTSTHKRTYQRDEATISDGFLVTGWPSDTPEKIKAQYDQILKLHEEKPKEHKHPGTWTEFERNWWNRNKPKRIGRAYSVASSAEVCAELARKAGWLRVSVDEQLKV